MFSGESVILMSEMSMLSWRRTLELIASLYMQKDGRDFLPTWLNNQEQSEDNFGNSDWSWSEEMSM